MRYLLLGLILGSFIVTNTHAAESEQSGALIVVGGGGLPESIVKRFVELGGGQEMRVVVIPTASSLPVDEEKIASLWQKRGAKEVHVLHTTDREVANSAEFIAPLKEATAVWIGGGSQSRLAEAYAGTAVEKELIALVQRGGVVGGTSAGAAIQSQVMIASGRTEPEIKTGLNLVPDAIIDQHFLKRNRMNRLLSAIDQYPHLYGIGIDEATAIEVQGRECRVLGNSFVVVVQDQGAGKMPNIRTFNQGESFELTPIE
ncbi:cyanophycinase [Bremerella cremea]|nr:cyanophycinase [Bremerella cremea]